LCKKKVKKKKKFFNMDDDYDNEKELPMDAVEIPAALTDGTESVASQPVSNINNDAPLNSTMDTTIDSIQSSTKTSHVDEDDNQSQQSHLSEDICLETEMTLIENNIEKEISCSEWGENPENGPATVMESNPKISILSRDEATTEENVHHCDGMVNEIIKDQDCSPHSVASRMRNQSFERSQSDDDDFVFSEVNVPDEDRKICSATDANKNVFRNDESVLDSSSARPTIEPVGSKDESVGEELGDLCSPVTLFSPLPLISRNSLATVTSEYTYDDDSTADDNLCPICLCGYQCGDILIESKHCTHIFHKGTQELGFFGMFMMKASTHALFSLYVAECILEWLEKKDCCPVCRESMITDSELKSAATSLVGKTRMYRAVASMQPTPVRAPFAVRRPTSVRAPAGRGGPSLGGNIALSGTGQHTIRRTFS
jgi:hypothetical protein